MTARPGATRRADSITLMSALVATSNCGIVKVLLVRSGSVVVVAAVTVLVNFHASGFRLVTIVTVRVAPAGTVVQVHVTVVVPLHMPPSEAVALLRGVVGSSGSEIETFWAS